MCPTGYLHNQDYSPGRMVPRGAEVVETGGVGVTITHTWDTDHAVVKDLGESPF